MHSGSARGTGGEGGHRERKQQAHITEAGRYGVTKKPAEKNVACCNKCRELLAFIRLPLLQDTGLLCTRKNCLLQDGNKQQKRALSMARQEGRGRDELERVN